MMRSTASLLVKYHHLKYSQLVMKQKCSFGIIAKVFVKIYFVFCEKCLRNENTLFATEGKGILFSFQHYFLDKSSSDDGAGAMPSMKETNL